MRYTTRSRAGSDRDGHAPSPWLRRGVAVLAALVGCIAPGLAQDVTEPALKAAFIYNIAKFTEWPEDVLPTAATFTACVLGDASVAEALERGVKGRLIWGRSVKVVRIQFGGPLRSCHLLYVSRALSAEVEALVGSLQGAPILTISDVDDFSRLGGITYLFFENGKIRFDLDLATAKRARLQLSSKLLVLAARVYGRPDSAQR
jgi:hypothetical protein